MALGNLGIAHKNLGEAGAAADYFEQALAIRPVRPRTGHA